MLAEIKRNDEQNNIALVLCNKNFFKECPRKMGRAIKFLTARPNMGFKGHFRMSFQNN